MSAAVPALLGRTAVAGPGLLTWPALLARPTEASGELRGQAASSSR